MNIKKIKQTGDGIVIIYEQHSGKAGKKTTTLDEPDEPRAAFSEAMQALKEHLRKIIGYSAEFASDIIITSVSFSFSNKGSKSVVISGMKPMEVGSPYTPSTPSRMMDSEGDEEAKTQLGAEAVIALEKLESEALAYIKGERREKQDEMPLDGEGENSESEEE